MSKNRVLVITNMYPTEENKSFGIFVKNQVDALVKRGLEVDVAAITDPRAGKLNVMKKYFTWMLSTLQAFLSKGKQYEVVHAHYVFPSGLLGYFFKKRFRTRLIVTAHGGDIDKMARKSPWIYKWTKKILHEADHVIAVGQELYDTIHHEFRVEKERLSIINMGVNREVFKPILKEEARKLCGIEDGTRPILFVGNIIKQKGLLELVDAVSKLVRTYPQIQLYLIGATHNESFKRELIERIKAGNIENHVTYLGVKKQREVAESMAAAEVFVLPSHIEGFGLVALEAMSCGTPVVGTNVGGLKVLLDNDAGKIVPSQNDEALTEAIADLLSSKEKQELFIKNGEKKAEENDQERMINRVMDVYFPTGG